MKVRALLVGALLWCVSFSVAFAQCSGQAASGYACGNGAASTGFPSFYPLSTLFDRGIGSGQGTILNRTNTGWVATIAPTLGIPGTSQGTLSFAGATSGTATITAQATAGSPTITLPNTSGTLADGASSPLVLSATTGNLTCPTCVTSSGGGGITGVSPVNVSAAGAVSLQGPTGSIAAGSGGTGSSFTPTPTLGVAGATVGTIRFANATSGTVTIEPATGALGTAVATLAAGSYNLVGDSLTQALTNKTYNGLTITSTTGTLTVVGSKVLTANNSLTLDGTDGTTMTFPSASDTVAGLAATQTFTNKTINGNNNTLTVLAGSQLSGSVPLTNGGLGGSQSAATANQVPMFPGGGGAAVPTTIRTPLFSAVTLYVNPSSTTSASCNGSSGGVGSDSNAGTLAAPFLTPAHALNVAQTKYDARLNQVTIQYCDNNVTGATYPTLQDTANMVGAISGGSGTAAQLIIQGNTTTPSNVIVQGSSGTPAFTFVGVTSPVLVSYMQIGASTSGAATTGHGIDADAHSMAYYSHITWGYIGTGYSHVEATYGSFVEQEGPETIIGGAAIHWYADRVSQILTTGNTVTCTGTPAFSSAFVAITNGSVFNLNGASFSGCSGVTGTIYLADSTSSFGSGTADPNTLFPGNSNGSVTLPAFGLSGIIVGGGGSPTGASNPMTTMPAMNGDCTITLTTGAIVCTKTNGVAFGPLATSTTGKPILGGTGTTSTAQNTSVQFVGLSSLSATENNYFVSPNSYTLKNLYINLTAAPGGSLTQTATLRVGGSNTALTCTITGSATACHDTTHSVTVSASSAIDIGIQASSSSAPATIVGWGVEAY